MALSIQSPRDGAIIGLLAQLDGQLALLQPNGGMILLEVVKKWQIRGWRLPDEGMEGEWYNVGEGGHLLWAAKPDEAGCYCLWVPSEGGCIFLGQVERFSRDRMRWMRKHCREWQRVFGHSVELRAAVWEANGLFELWEMEVML